MTVTIRDVARQANVGLGTVSRVINGADHVRPSTRAKVEAAMRALGYYPNPHASNLKRQSALSIGLLFTSNRRRSSDPFFSVLLSGIADAAGAYRYDLLVASCSGPEDEMQRLERFVAGARVGGMILTDKRIDDERIEWLLTKRFPFVVFGRMDDKSGVPWLDVDSRLGVEQAVTHLIQLGHRRIAFIGLPDDLLVARDRFEGYRAALHRAGCSLHRPYIVTGCWSEMDGAKAAQHLLDLACPPTAIMASSDVIAFGVMRTLQARNLAAGRDIALVGFDDIPMAAYSVPPLTTVHQPIYEIGAELVSMLVQRLAGRPVKSHFIQPQLMIRRSCGHANPPRAHDHPRGIVGKEVIALS